MREIATRSRIVEFMRRLGSAAKVETKVYFTGGATAVLFGWRQTTIDVDLKIVPESDDLFRAIPALKETLNLNVELASPDLFIPPLPEWESRCLFISHEGRIDWYHFDPYAQALAKIERDHERDREDVRELIGHGLVQVPRLRELFHAIKPALIRFPSIDAQTFAKRVEAITP